MTPSEIAERARAFVDELLLGPVEREHGHGVGTRLQVKSATEGDLGGWCRAALRREVEKLLAAALARGPAEGVPERGPVQVDSVSAIADVLSKTASAKAAGLEAYLRGIGANPDTHRLRQETRWDGGRMIVESEVVPKSTIAPAPARPEAQEIHDADYERCDAHRKQWRARCAELERSLAAERERRESSEREELFLSNALAAERERAEGLERSLVNARANVSAYQRAKQENDDRYMVERDQARSELAEARAALGFYARVCATTDLREVMQDGGSRAARALAPAPAAPAQATKTGWVSDMVAEWPAAAEHEEGGEARGDWRTAWRTACSESERHQSALKEARARIEELEASRDGLRKSYDSWRLECVAGRKRIEELERFGDRVCDELRYHTTDEEEMVVAWRSLRAAPDGGKA